jgi:hypothetical protein
MPAKMRVLRLDRFTNQAGHINPGSLRSAHDKLGAREGQRRGPVGGESSASACLISS